ncbi:amino acid transporter [Mycobacterium frederiksbergense]|uniref:Amino acid transporter n=1 Tax=Mycolicibacterium frederiksbergense TaxID=117567 RepID=A0ABT6L630_9MYCO|nr:APC family permease [Mycolicibacterium frederiksbergense]MDH6198390.1 amino acid transporter [Mycolicibacterium frederiksbergense]
MAEPGTPSPKEAGNQLKAGAMGVRSIVFMVVATAAPLTAMASAFPLAVALGNGIGAPGTYVAVALVLALFAVGYAAMSRHLTNAGAFFAYVTVGLGRRMGMAAGMVAVLAYNLLVLYVVGLVGYFANEIFATELGVDIPWQVFSFSLLALALIVGILGVEVNARVLGVLLILETGLLLLVDIATLAVKGPAAYPISSLNPAEIFSGAVGIGFMFVFISFIGFEATAIFGEEARDPRRTVPRATKVAIGFVGIVYLLTSWSLIAASGGADAQAAAAADPGNFMFNAAGSVLGGWSVHVMSWLLLTSLIAVLFALHGMATRYLMAFGREGALPRPLGRTHPRFQTPHIAACVQAAVVALAVIGYSLAGADPYLDLGNQTAGVGALGVISLMGVTSIAVIGFFLRRPDRHWWTHIVAPALAAAGLFFGCYLIIANYPLLTGSESAIVNGMPWLLVIVAVIGLIVGSVRPLRTNLDIFGTGEVTEDDHNAAAPAPSSAPVSSDS